MDEEGIVEHWWQQLAPERRAQIYRWVTQNKHVVSAPGPGQLTLIQEGEEE